MGLLGCRKEDDRSCARKKERICEGCKELDEASTIKKHLEESNREVRVSQRGRRANDEACKKFAACSSLKEKCGEADGS